MLLKSKICVTPTLSLLFFYTVNAQIINPTHWSFVSKKAGLDLYDTQFTATVDAPWHIYSQFLAPGGPIATKISLAKNPLVTITGKLKESADQSNIGRGF